MLRPALLLALVASCLALLPASASAKATIGIADQSADTFTDPLFGQLGVRHARLNLAWDVFKHDWQVEQLDGWMKGAQAAGVRPVVIFSQSRVPGRTRVLPTPAQYRETVRELRSRYPWVNELAAWNEMNYPGQPSYRKPQVVAQFYKVLRAECRGCKVLPGSLLDNPNVVSWAKRLRKEIRKLRQPDPKIWGLHNYSDVNRLRDTTTRKVLKAVKGRLWLTETGGVVRATSPTASKYQQGPAFAGKVTAYLLGTFAKRNPRVERIFFYEWKAPEGDVSWDSGLVSPTGEPRPGYTTVKKHLGR